MLGGFWGYGFFDCTSLTPDGICETSFIESLTVNIFFSLQIVRLVNIYLMAGK
jgi:hypothetical protein